MNLNFFAVFKIELWQSSHINSWFTNKTTCHYLNTAITDCGGISTALLMKNERDYQSLPASDLRNLLVLVSWFTYHCRLRYVT